MHIQAHPDTDSETLSGCSRNMHKGRERDISEYFNNIIVSSALNIKLYLANSWYKYKRLKFIEQVKRSYFPYLVKSAIDFPENHFDDPRFNKK